MSKNSRKPQTNNAGAQGNGGKPPRKPAAPAAAPAPQPADSAAAYADWLKRQTARGAEIKAALKSAKPGEISRAECRPGSAAALLNNIMAGQRKPISANELAALYMAAAAKANIKTKASRVGPHAHAMLGRGLWRRGADGKLAAADNKAACAALAK